MTDPFELENLILQSLAGDGNPENSKNWKNAPQIAQELNEPLEEVQKAGRRLYDKKKIISRTLGKDGYWSLA